MKNLFIQEIMCGLQSENVTGKKKSINTCWIRDGWEKKICIYEWSDELSIKGWTKKIKQYNDEKQTRKTRGEYSS